MSLDGDDPERTERITLIPCLACGGEHRRFVEIAPTQFGFETCSHCTQGCMNEGQVQRWRARRSQGAERS